MSRFFIIWLFLFFPFLCFAQRLTSVGTEFYIAFPPNSNAPAPLTLLIFISSEYTTSGSISSDFPGVNQVFSVTPGIVTQITVPSGVALVDNVENKGIKITSLAPVSVYGISSKTASSDGYLALPVSSLGVDYRVLSYGNTAIPDETNFSIVATEKNTVVTIYNHLTGLTSTVNLDDGQTCIVKATGVSDDLTGSRIQSNYPVAVFGSVKSTNVPASCIFSDHIVEQLLPVSAWSNKFITVPLAGRDASGDIFRILANYDGTDVTINGTLSSTLDAGEYYEANLAGYNSIITSKRTLVAQYAKGLVCSGSITGDPFMMLIPPREQYLTNYTISTVPGFTEHWVNISAPYDAIGAIYQDGVLIPSVSFVQAGTTGYYGTRISIAEGSHTFTSTLPFGVFVYGWIEGGSYGYPGGESLCPIGSIGSVTISPDTANGILNVSTVCLTAHVEDSLFNPLADVLVTFDIIGLNPSTITVTTDSAGNAQYCYTQTGSDSCVDLVSAEICGVTSDTSSVTWTNIPPCINPANGGNIGHSQAECGSYTPVPITSLVLPAGQSGTIEYKWEQSIIDGSSGFTDIPGSNSAAFAPGFITQTTWYKRLARVDCMSDWAGAASSNVIEMTVIPLVTPGVTIAASANSICQGTSVTFTAMPANGGTSPSYQWKVNGANTGTDSPTYDYIPANGDQVTCVLTSNVLCSTVTTATSNTVTMIINTNMPVNVSISANPNPFCPGVTVSYIAAPVNEGTSPVYQWKVNDNNTGINSMVFSFSPQQNDSVWCIMTSNLSCVTGSPATSNKITMTAFPVPAVTFTGCFDSITTINAKPIKLKGGIPLDGIYTGPGVNSTTGVFTPSTAGTGAKTITYSYTNVTSCSAAQTKTIIVQPNSAFTCGNNLIDIRDGKVYSTIQFGSQCWMASNLNFGTRIRASSHQRDNCTPEKYCYNDLTANCKPGGAFYQWDELMRYDDTPGLQGFCPPGWHVPTETDWNTLFANWINNAFAGAPLKNSGFSGFNATMSGVSHQNVQWDYQNVATFFWSSVAYGANKAWAHGMNDYDPSVALYPSLRSNAFSVRCLKD